MSAQEQNNVFGLTKKIGDALYHAKTVLRQSYIMKKEFIRMHPNVHDSVEETSLVPMDLSVRTVATVDNVEEHLKQMHTSMRHLLGLIICYIEMDQRVRGPKTDLLADSAKIVRVYLEQLLNETKDLMTGSGPHLETTPYKHAECTPEEHTEAKNMDFLIFAYRLLDDLPIWAQLMYRNLLVYRQKKEEHEMATIQQ